MKAAGLRFVLGAAFVSPEERARLAERLSHGKPLSEIIIKDREDRA